MDGKGTTGVPLQFLSSWKEIANYIGKGVRTVQRYEHDFGLPVRRPTRRRVRGSVIATKIEIDAWLKAIPLREAYPRSHSNKGDSLLSIVQNLNAGAVRMSKLFKDTVALRAELEATRKALRNNLATLSQELRRQANPPEPTRDESQEAILRKGASTRVH